MKKYRGLGVMLLSVWLGAFLLFGSGECRLESGFIPMERCIYTWWTLPTFFTSVLAFIFGFVLLITDVDPEGR